MSNYPKFANFGEYLFYAYANVQMLFFAVKSGIPKYNRLCYMIRAKAFKAYKEGRWKNEMDNIIMVCKSCNLLAKQV